jgi:hypothetical protein
VLVDALAAQLAGGGEVAVAGGEGCLKDHKVADLLVRGEPRVEGVDLRPEHRPQVGGVGEGVQLLRVVVGASPLAGGLLAEGQERGEEGATLAQQHRLLDPSRLLERSFDRLGSDLVPPGGDEQLFFAADDPEAPILDDPLVAGVEPPLLVKDPAGLLGAVPVAGEDVGPPEQDLLLAGDASFDPRDGRAHGARLQASGEVDVGGGGGLGEPVALQQRDAQAAEPLREGGGQGGTAGEGEAEPTAEDPPELFKDEVIGGPVLKLERQGDRLALSPASGHVDADLDGTERHGFSEPLLCQRAEHPGVELLEEAGHSTEERGLDLRQLVEQVGGTLGEGRPVARLELGHLQDAGEHMGHR